MHDWAHRPALTDAEARRRVATQPRPPGHNWFLYRSKTTGRWAAIAYPGSGVDDVSIEGLLRLREEMREAWRRHRATA